MERAERCVHHVLMRNHSGLVKFGLTGLVLGLATVAAGFVISGEVGALLRGYGAMLLPAAAYLFAGLGLRHLLADRTGRESARAPIMISARDGSARP